MPMRRVTRRMLAAGIGMAVVWMLWPSASMAATCDEFTKVPGERFGFQHPSAVSTSSLADGTNVTDVTVRVKVVHPYVKDVSLSLSHDGVTINLSSDNGPDAFASD